MRRPAVRGDRFLRVSGGAQRVSVVKPDPLVVGKLRQQCGENLQRLLVLAEHVVGIRQQRAVVQVLRLEREQPLEQGQHRLRLLLTVQDAGQVETGVAVAWRQPQTLPEQRFGFHVILALGCDPGQQAHCAGVLWRAREARPQQRLAAATMARGRAARPDAVPAVRGA
jgi:hypothetical protein